MTSQYLLLHYFIMAVTRGPLGGLQILKLGDLKIIIHDHYLQLFYLSYS